MKPLAKMTLWGIVLVIVGPLVGIIGTVWSIYSSFGELERNESAGIGAVGAEIQYAMMFSIFGVLVMIIGILMIIMGIRKTRT